MDWICPGALPALDSGFILNRIEANHVPRLHGKECLLGLWWFSLSVPSAREDAALSVGVETLLSIVPGPDGVASPGSLN